ncbi:DJ-1/PfpI family protein [Gluconacetobacter aggeris]
MIASKRREIVTLAAGVVAASVLNPDKSKAEENSLQGSKYFVSRATARPKPKIGMLIFPGVTSLDLIGPQSVLATTSDIFLIWKNKNLLLSDSGLILKPDTTLEESPKNLDVLFVPGGPGQVEVMRDSDVLKFLADRGSRANYVTSVCTGALVLGAAGLLQGYKAGTHWAALSLLPLFGAKPMNERVVVDRNRLTGGGVTAGIDFGLTLLSALQGERVAKVQELAMQYDPHPPFNVGTPEKAGPDVTRDAITWIQAYGVDMIGTAHAAKEDMQKYTILDR